MRLSVAMCTYNGARYLQEQLDSIVAQTRLPDEMVICDDGSRDNTFDLLSDFANNVPFPVRIYSNPENLGSTKNFEQAIRLCEGDVIALSDQDDIWHREKLERIEQIFRDSPSVGLVFSDAEMIDEESRPLDKRLWAVVQFRPHEQERFRRGMAANLLLKRNFVTGATMAFRTGFRQIVLPIHSEWIHDGWIALLLSAVTDLEPIPDALIRYRKHPQQQFGTRRGKPGFSSGPTLQTGQQEYLSFAKIYHPVLERLSQISETNRCSEVIAQVNDKIRHIEARAAMPRSFIQRLPLVLRELSKGRYHHSNGWRSIGKDVFRRA